MSLAIVVSGCERPQPSANALPATPVAARAERDAAVGATPQPPESPRRTADPDVVVTTVGPDPSSAGRVTIVALHGLGDSPESFGLWLRATPVSARVLAIRAPERFGSGSAWWQPGGGDAFIAGTMTRSATHVRERFTEAMRGQTSCGQPILLGFSQGAMVSFALAGRREIPFRLIIPIGGRLPIGSLEVAPFERSDVQVRAMHGAIDTRVPLVGGRLAVEALRGRGLDATLRTFENVGHSIPDEVRAAVFDEILRVARDMGCVPRARST